MKFRGAKKALFDFIDYWVGLVDSGDAGFWNPFDDEIVKQSLKALDMTKEQFIEATGRKTDNYIDE